MRVAPQRAAALAALLASASACPGAVVHNVCWQLSEPGASCAGLCGSAEAVNVHLTISGASSSEVVRALDSRYELDASYFDEQFPARACTGGAQIVFGFKVEIAAIAYKDEKQ